MARSIVRKGNSLPFAYPPDKLRVKCKGRGNNGVVCDKIRRNTHQFSTEKAPRKVLFLSRRGDSNARPPRPERGALPTALLLDRKTRGNPEKSLNVTPRNLLHYEQIYTFRYIALP